MKNKILITTFLVLFTTGCATTQNTADTNTDTQNKLSKNNIVLPEKERYLIEIEQKIDKLNKLQEATAVNSSGIWIIVGMLLGLSGI